MPGLERTHTLLIKHGRITIFVRVKRNRTNMLILSCLINKVCVRSSPGIFSFIRDISRHYPLADAMYNGIYLDAPLGSEPLLNVPLRTVTILSYISSLAKMQEDLGGQP